MLLKFKYNKIKNINYSGKKKRHTLKFEVIVSTNGRILNVSKCFDGKTHDFNIRKSSEHIPKPVEVIADSGYQDYMQIQQYPINDPKVN